MSGWPRGFICPQCRQARHGHCQTFALGEEWTGAYRMCACFYEDVETHRWASEELPELVGLIGRVSVDAA